MSTVLGCPRVSTGNQNLDGQRDVLKEAGAGRLCGHHHRHRPRLDHLLDQLRPGDVVVVAKYGWLARSLKDLLEIVEAIGAKGAGFRSLAEDIDTAPAERLVIHMYASISEFERGRIAERTREGLEVARKRGRAGGRLPALSPSQRSEARRMRDGEGRCHGQNRRPVQREREGQPMGPTALASGVLSR